MFFYLMLAVIIAVSLVATQAGQVAFFKLRAYAHGGVFFIKSKDLPKTFNGSNYIKMESNHAYVNGRRTIRVVFIRHGQSVWNSLFNSLNAGLPMRWVKAVIRESICLFTDPFDSLIIDSPLSSKGRKEANELASFVRAANGKISVDPNTSVIVASNLRRAMETALVGLGPRISTTNEQIVMDSSLQEGSKNIDAQTISTEPNKIAPVPIGSIKEAKQLVQAFDPYLNAGDKVIGVDVYQRMDVFVRHLFGASGDDSLLTSNKRGNAELKEVIVVGHSGYFRNFFRRFLPTSSKHIAKASKMQNCAVVAFNFVHNESNGELSVEEESIQILYKGFK
ncbi:hypothetical protein AGDE_01433 [Angomonas deanei]|uniref:Histidine phosphatase superfamily (Branch 1), putative n=1 Tax=Angomonas deanei TaxID=59799 RepID=S9X285_9TRYP|nr:hypothetical protein AGDE_10278 [Angomonas deanei]EPY42490.1 hypothetical protein AGDE_01433 [Angomonas deanei]CAD2216539.1 Histidine phosphatase superfamily (branch 1), putative [Angomonas deanei]|eukprot:EPY28796.1 hypothetical protein AGDE_10278 [Angomonas deanei]